MIDTIDNTPNPEELYAVNVTIALLAILLFVIVGAQVMPASFHLPGFGRPPSRESNTAFLLNIALIILAWRRSVDFKKASLARAAAEKRVHELAYKDEVTGLHNRRYLIERLEAAAVSATGEHTLLFIDIDHFKTVNDLFGHSTGDELLAEIARRILDVSPRDACCARLGGDEFAILLDGTSAQKGSATSIAEDLLKEIGKPIPLGQALVQVSASIGLSTLNATKESLYVLMRRSDVAMYESKSLGRNGYTWFDAEAERALNDRTALEGELRAGITEKQFVPHFQPLFDINSGNLKGFEVLARWEHPTRGMIEPDCFISAAEGAGMIAELSANVMRQALICARDWPAHLTISVNISPLQFKDPMLALDVVKLLEETGFQSNRLEIEITESSLINNHELAASTVARLKNCGIRISLDDFGTGYASLTQLRSLDFDSIKIDRRFIANLLEDEQDFAIVHAITTLGQSLRVPITAEGVETLEVYRKLQDLGCTYAQGWLFGRAYSASEIERKFLQGECQVNDNAVVTSLG